MRSSSPLADRLILLLLCLSVSLPFFNFARFSPVPDWWTHALVVLPVTLALLLALWRGSDAEEDWSLSLPRFLPWALLWWCLAFMPAVLRRTGGLYSLALSEALAFVLVLVAACLLFKLQARLGRQAVVTALAVTMLVTALLQALIGVAQLLDLARLANGLLVYSPQEPRLNIMGNVAQRNQFAHVLTWGVLAAAYLCSIQRLHFAVTVLAMAFLALVMAWSGGRLPLAYAGAMLVVAVCWYWRNRDVRLLQLLLTGALLILLMQWCGGWLAQWLTGLPINSGLDRLHEAGFGARRRIEWDKAWLMVSAHPWVGVGFGGYAYYSTWLEAFGNFSKLPENALFTHSHNLIAQLLAETGIPATIVAALGVTVCLLPFWKKQHASSDNAFLLLLAATILGHSMFEYPLWYLPFLSAFLFVLVLSPLPALQLAVRVSLRRLGTVLLAAGGVAYIAFGIPAFWAVIRSQQPTPVVAENQQRIETLLQIARNPFWSYEAELTLGNYLVPTPQDIEIKRRHYEQLARYRPYPMLLCYLAMFRAWDKQPDAALEAMRMAIAAYPDSLAPMLLTLSARREAEIQPLTRLVLAARQAYQRGGAVAAVNTVASPSLVIRLP